ncbi:unnamed protein product [Oppiella nova]|uniref:SecA family profile domain-containing protein n=1 Tax=Oppiella nova TaxID=334625 RepID=A0A7R9QBI8_9ACAR|nr:unnamed protein product [Oppiella nova]CAG2162404.1 unnamed protein product [Oppiella nova]
MQTNQQGHISQINTGEGKTTIVCLIQALKVMQGYNGHVITSNNVLAADGVKDKQLFYQILNITAAHNNPDEKYTNGPRECYSKDVVYGSINNFQFDWLRDSFEQLKTLGDTNFDNSWEIMGRQSAEQDSPEAQAELELKNQREFEDYEDELRKSFLDKVKEKIKAKKNDLINKKLLASHLHQYTEDSVERWIEYAFSAKYQYSENVEYKMAKGQDGENIIIPVDNQNTGVSMQNTILSNGLHQFLQIKHNLCLTYESLTSCYVSNLDYIKKYGTKLSGVTGTLGSDAERGLLGSVFNLGFSVMPPFKPKQFISFSGKVSKDEDFINDVSVAALSELTRTRMKSNVEGESKAEGKQVEVGAPRAVLIVCAKVKKIAEEIKREATAAGLSPKIRIYTDEMQAHVIEETLGINEIVIATNLAGRGTDFKTTKKLEQNGGLHVIEAFLPCNKRVEDQGFGRTARQDTENVDFDQVLNQRDELEAARIEDIKENKITELKFKDLLFEKFSSQYARLKNEHKTGADPVKVLKLGMEKKLMIKVQANPYIIRTKSLTKGNIDSLIKQLNGENEFEKPKEALGSTDGIIMDLSMSLSMSLRLPLRQELFLHIKEVTLIVYRIKRSLQLLEK